MEYVSLFWLSRLKFDITETKSDKDRDRLIDGRWQTEWDEKNILWNFEI